MSTDNPTTPTGTDALDADELRTRLDREIRLRTRLIDIARQLTSTLDHDALISMIMADAVKLVGAETASVLEVDEETGELVISFASGGIAEQITSMRVPKGQGIGGWVVAHGQTAVVNEPEHDDRFYTDLDDQTGFETINMVAVPLRTRDRIVGVLQVINKAPAFTAEDQELVEGLGALAAIALENASTYARLADAIVTARMSYRR